VDAFVQLHNNERPYLLNPYVDNSDNYFAWKADDIIKEVELIFLPSDPSTKHFVDAAINDYGLNRHELKTARYFYYSLFKAFKIILSDTGINTSSHNQVQQKIAEMKSDDAPFAGMIRYFDSRL